MVALPNTKIDSSMIEEFSSPIFEEQNHKKYMFVDEDGKVIYKDVTALIDDINEDGGILGTNNKVVIRDWEPNYEYKEKETITYNNAIWKCIVKKSKKEEFDFNDWKMLAGYSKSSEFFYDAENEITEIVLEEEVASKGSFLININNLLLQSNNYFLNSDNKTITFVNPVPKDTQIEVTVFGNMIIPTNVDNVVTKTFTTIVDGETEFFVDEPMYKKGLVTVNIENKVLLQSEWELNEGTDGIILKNGVPAGTRVQIQYFNNLDLSIGATFTPHVSKSGRIVTISWTNDQDLPNPETVTIEDGITFTPIASKIGKKSTISWSNDGGKENPQTLNIFDGATFTPHVSKTDYTTTLSWTNDGDLPNPQNVQILDGVNFIPSSSRNNNYITISWSNDQGKQNPNDAILYDGTTFTPQVEKIGKTTTLSWTNDGGKENPDDVNIVDGTTFIPNFTKEGNQAIISWTNDGGMSNPQNVTLYDGTTFTPSWNKIGYTANISWTNDGGKKNPPVMQLFDGVTFTPHTTRTGNRTTLSWTNNQGKQNPESTYIFDGAIFTPHIVDYEYNNKRLYWTNDRDLPNPSDSILIGGTTFTPVITTIDDSTDRISWINDGGKENPQSIDISDGTTFTPIVTKNNYTATIAWSNDDGKENPESVEIKDGIIYLPNTIKNGIKTTLYWTNDQGASNPPSTIISDGVTFTPSVTKLGKTTTLSWSNNDNLENPSTVEIKDGVNYIPDLSKSGYTTTLSWSNDSGLPNPADTYIYDGVTFTPQSSKSGLITTISWSNDQGKQNPNSFDISDGTTFTPRVEKTDYTTTISWSNDGGKINPSTVQITDGINWTPHVYKDSEAYKTTLSWTNDQGVSNPDPVDIYEGRIYDVLLNGTSIVNERVASFTLGTMSQEDKNDYVLLSAYNDKINELEDADQTLQNNIDSEENRASNVEGNLSNLSTSDKTNLVSAINEVHNNTNDVSDDLSTHIADTNNPHSVTKAQVGLGNVDNTSDLDKPISTATQTALDGKVDKVTTPSRVYGTDASGNQITYDYDSFGKVDDVKVDGTSVVTNKIANLGSMASESTANYYKKTDLANIATSGSWNDLSNTPTTLSGYGITDAYTKTEVDGLISSTFHYKGSVNTYADLPSSEQQVGDVWNVATADTTHGIKAGDNVCWDGNNWDVLSGVVDLSVYDNHIANKNNPHQVTKEQVGLGNVDNTSDLDKPISTATQEALQNEINRAIDRETALNTNIQDEITRSTNKDQELENNKADKSTVYTKTEIDNMLTGAMHFKGSLATLADLENIQNPSVGDMYNVEENGANYAWDGTTWIKMSETVDLSDYALTSYVDSKDLEEKTARENADALKVDKVTTPSRVYGTDELGQPITYGVSLFGKIDDVTVGGVSVVTNRVAVLGTMASETAADYSTKAIADTLYADKTTTDSHIADTNNPHQVTKAQVGLSNVDNTSDLDKPISTATQEALDGKLDKVTTSKKVYGTDDSGNQTTYDYDSFGKVDDVKVGGASVVTDKIANLGTMASETAADYSTKAIADTLYADKTTTDNHITNTNNPHSVTKEQVGLGNVDNTSDLDKPISAATQAALDGKVDDVKVNGTSVVTDKVANLGSMASEAADDYSTKEVADTLYVGKVSATSKVYGTDESGNQTTYDYNSFGKVDDVKIGATSLVINKVVTLGSMADEDEDDWGVEFKDWSL